MTFPVVFIVLILIAFLERILPFRQNWNKTDDDVGNDAIHLIITQTLIPRLFIPIGSIILAAVTTAWLARKTGNQLWPHHWHLFIPKRNCFRTFLPDLLTATIVKNTREYLHSLRFLP